MRAVVAGTHDALIYRGPEEFATAVTEFVHEGVSGGERTLVMVGRDKAERLQSDLGADADAVLFADATLATWPQSRCTRAALEFLGGSNGGRSRVVTEQDLLRRIPLQVQDYLTVESAANIVYAAFSVAVLCTYDAAVLSPDLLLGCQRTHRRILKERSFGDSPHFLEPAAFLAGGSAVVHPPAGASSLSCDLPADLATARALVRSRAMEAGFDGPILDDLVLAAGEVLTNALIVGQAPRIMHVYLEGRRSSATSRTPAPAWPTLWRGSHCRP